MIDRIGSRHTFRSPSEPAFPFHDLATGESWTLRPNAGRIPWWLLSARRRVPGTTVTDYLGLRDLLRASPHATVRQVAPPGVLFHRLVEPLAVAALNTPASRGSAALLGAIIRETLMRGGRSCLAAFPRQGWSESIADPALDSLRAAGQQVSTSRRITQVVVQDGRAIALQEQGRSTTLSPMDQVVLAVPAERASDLLPGLLRPQEHESIVNLHYKATLIGPEAGFLGLVGGLAEWLFFKPGIVSVTISAANRLSGVSAATLGEQVWREIQAACGSGDPLPPHRLVREKRATFAATPEQARQRPSCRTWLPNVFLAGDWTATGLPATIEGAIRSGFTAGEIVTSAVGD